MFKKLFQPVTATLGFIQKYFKALLFLLIVALLWPKSAAPTHAPNLTEIALTGPIMDARKTVEALEEAREDPNIRGVLFYVDSPGGAVAPSVEISLALQRLAKAKPVVAYAGGTMASGSYYASIHATKIMANPAATIGSIGVIMEGMNIRPLMNKIGITPQVVKAGRYKEAGTPLREWTPAERQEIQTHVRDIYRMFVHDVAQARGLDENRSDRFADAKIFIAKKALKVGLIDTIGSLHEAKKAVEKLSHVKEPRWKKRSKWEKYLQSLADESARAFTAQLRAWSIR